MNWLTNPSSVAVICSWIGVLAGIVGAGVAGQGALRWLWESAKARLISASRHTRGWLARFLPFLRKTHSVSGGVAAAWTVSGNVTGSNADSTHDWPVSASTNEDRLEVLRKRIADQHRLLLSIDESMLSRINELGEHTNREIFDLRNLQRSVLADLQRAKERETEIDARGLIPLGLSVLLCGVPTYLANVPSVAWCAIVAALAATAWAISSTVWDHRRAKSVSAFGVQGS